MLGIAPQAVLHMASLFAAQDVDGASLVQATAISLFFVAVAILYGLALPRPPESEALAHLHLPSQVQSAALRDF